MPEVFWDENEINTVFLPEKRYAITVTITPPSSSEEESQDGEAISGGTKK